MAFRTGENFDGIPGVDSAEVTLVDPVEFLNKQYSAEMRILESEAEELVRQGKSTQDLEELMRVKAEKYANERNELIDRLKTESKEAALAKLNQEFSGEMRILDEEAETLARSGKPTGEIESSMSSRRAEYDKARSSLLVDQMGNPVSSNTVIAQNQGGDDMRGAISTGLSEVENIKPEQESQSEIPDYPVLTDVVTEEEYQRAVFADQSARLGAGDEEVVDVVKAGQQHLSRKETPVRLDIHSPSSLTQATQTQSSESWFKRVLPRFFRRK